MIVLIMGVSGSGKTTVGQKLAADLGWCFYDADDYHPPSNVAKMAQGNPLTDADRQPWLIALRTGIDACIAAGQSAVFAVSALKQAHRQVLMEGQDTIRLVNLKGNYDLIRQRMATREGHFFKPELLQSQFETLEEPEEAITVEIDHPLDAMVQIIRQHLGC